MTLTSEMGSRGCQQSIRIDVCITSIDRSSNVYKGESSSNGHAPQNSAKQDQNQSKSPHVLLGLKVLAHDPADLSWPSSETYISKPAPMFSCEGSAVCTDTRDLREGLDESQDLRAAALCARPVCTQAERASCDILEPSYCHLSPRTSVLKYVSIG